MDTVRHRFSVGESRKMGETGLFVSVQTPLALGEHGEPQPDLTLVRRRGDRSGVPIAEEALLVVEVAATSLIYNREMKLPLNARDVISEAWLVDLNADEIRVYSELGLILNPGKEFSVHHAAWGHQW